MLAQVFIPITVDAAGEHPAHTVYPSEGAAVDHVLANSERYRMRPNATIHRRRHGNVITVESDDWKLGYVILARVSHQ